MLKSINPKETWDFSSMLCPETVFTYKARAGSAAFARNADLLYDDMVNTCITKITNIAIHITTKVTKDEKEVEETNLVEFKEYIPSEHKEVLLSKVLPTVLCTNLGDKIYTASMISEKESGE